MEEKKENKERVVLKQTLEMLMEAVYSKNPAKITKAYAKYYKNIQQELDSAREEGILLGVFGKDNRCVEDKIVDLKYLHSMGEIGDKEYKKALSKLTTK